MFCRNSGIRPGRSNLRDRTGKVRRGGRGSGRPADSGVELVVGFARRSFKDKTHAGDAAKEYAATIGLKLEEIGPSVEFLARLVFQLERFAVLAEETRCVVFVVESQAKDKRSLFGFCVFENGVAIPGPCG